MIRNWTSWKRLPNAERGEYVEAPIGPGIYEVRNMATGDLAAFDASSNVAHALAALRKPQSTWSKLFGGDRQPARGPELEYRTCAAASVNEARYMVQALTGRRQVYMRRSAPQASFAGSV